MTSDRCGSIAAPFPSVQRWQRKYVVGNYLPDALEIIAASNADAFPNGAGVKKKGCFEG